MADRTIGERLQPSLLDRLTDDVPHERREARDARVIDIRRLREIIRRDLGWLLNTTNIESLHDMEAHPHVANSVLNFGIADVAGTAANQSRVLEVQRMIRHAIERFEPRIRPETLEIVARDAAEGDIRATVGFDIRGDLWAQPMPLELYLRSELDVTTGELKLERVA